MMKRIVILFLCITFFCCTNPKQQLIDEAIGLLDENDENYTKSVELIKNLPEEELREIVSSANHNNSNIRTETPENVDDMENRVEYIKEEISYFKNRNDDLSKMILESLEKKLKQYTNEE